jgi:hypothetical protein
MIRALLILCLTFSAGAADEWWSLRPLVSPPVPGGGHPIDAFINASLKEKQLSPAPPVDGRTLVRRIYFDLHGLPPSPEEVDRFTAACAEGEPETQQVQIAALTEQLLASPRYGERWARHWFDVIHFADSHGFEHDVFRDHAWRYRDYVIAALNTDTAWPRFIREQLAADVFYPDAPRLTAALGFLGAGTYDMSAAGTAITSFEYLDRDDLVTQTMAAFVSTTANCARCHAHKFDPITQEDYFALQAVFAGIGKGDINYDEDAAVAKKRRHWTALKEAAVGQDAALLLNDENAALVAAWEKDRGPVVPWRTVLPEVFTSLEGTTLERLEGGALLSSGARPDKDVYTIAATPGAGDINAVRLDLLPHDSLPAKGPGRPDNGNVHLSEVEVQVFRAASGKPEKVAVKRAVSSFDQEGFGIAGAIDGKPATSWAIHPREGQAHAAVFELRERLKLDAADRLVITLRQLQGGAHLLGHFKLAVAAGENAVLTLLPEAVAAALSVSPDKRTPGQRVALAAFVLNHRADEVLAALPPQAKVWAAGKSAKNERGIISYTEPRPIHVLHRGELDKPREAAAPGALAAVAALPARFELKDFRDESARRAALADWTAHPQNPLTWRSIVNRVWHYHFGRGICDTPSDFGRMGGVPSHPALLDWLAVWFRDEAKGSLKALHQLILTSETWRRSSQPAPGGAAAAQLDPDNTLLWRGNRTRLDADCIRDAILAVSGRLDLTMGGPGAQHFTMKPGPQSTPVLDYNAFDWSQPAGARRSIYRVVWRGIADPFMEAADFPELGLLAPARGFSASALQSLALLNNHFVLHHSALLAQRAAEPAAEGDGIRRLFRLALQREPAAEEAEAFAALVKDSGLAAAARVIFNSNEFLFVD